MRGGEWGRGCRCPRLRTLVLVISARGLSSYEGGYLVSDDAADALCSAVRGCQALSAVQLVLGSRDWKRGSMARCQWATMAALPQLASLTLGWDFEVPVTNEYMCVYMATCLRAVRQRPCLTHFLFQGKQEQLLRPASLL